MINCSFRVSDIVPDYKELITATQTELTKLREELFKTKEEIEETLKTNESTTKLSSNLNKEIIDNFNQQIQFLKQERDTLNSLWKVSQQTIDRLESEISNYRSHLGLHPNTLQNIKERYEDALSHLQENVKTQKKVISKQFKTNCEVVAEGIKAQDQIKELKGKLKNMEPNREEINAFKKENEALKIRNSELEIMLKKAHRKIDEQMSSEQEALEKAQQAKRLSESAVKEKNTALHREKICKEECNNFVTIIGEVMDDAAKKVEDDYKDLKEKHKIEMKNILHKNKRIIKDLEESKISLRKAEINYSKIATKCADLMKVNATLETNLELSSKAIVELEMKIKAYDKLIQRDMRAEE